MEDKITEVVHEYLEKRENWPYTLSQAEFDEALALRLDMDTVEVGRATARMASWGWIMAYMTPEMRKMWRRRQQSA